jgi:hypothetical protein
MAKRNKNRDIGIVLKREETSDKKSSFSKPIQKDVLTLFLFLVPILLMAYTQEIFTKIGLFFYEAVLLQNYITDQYRKKEI